jgi:hypothetical protein
MFVGGDETVEKSPSIERLQQGPLGEFSRHFSSPMNRFPSLPDNKIKDGRIGEVDIEGLSRDGDMLWVVGSHSLTRKQPQSGKEQEKNTKRLSTVEPISENRLVLARIPLSKDADGITQLPDDQTTLPRAARLKGANGEDALREALLKDPHLGPFLQPFQTIFPDGAALKFPGIPSKDNGFDIEGLAVKQDRIFLGLRGPVLRGWATILEVGVTQAQPDELRLRPLDSKGALYRKHFINLNGLGVRDLCFDGDDLLILAGPTMQLDGPVAIDRWKQMLAATSQGDTLTNHSKDGALQRLIYIPHGDGCDHAEGMAVLPRNAAGQTEVLILYDSPDPVRFVAETGIKGDVFILP